MSIVDSAKRPFIQSIPVILIAGCLIAVLNGGPRSTMGFFLTPMSSENGWGREIFALAIAIQNLVWGIGQPFVGMLADKFGTARVLTGGALLYVLGLVLMANTTDPVTLQFTAGVLIGLGISGSAFMLAMAAFARLLPEKMRTLAYGLGTSGSSVGQFIFAPLGQAFIQSYGWQTALLIMAGFVLLIPVFAYAIRGKPKAMPTVPGKKDQSIPDALREAFGHGSYRLLVLGFFVCGFQVAFIIVHLPPYLADIGIPAIYAGYSLALIGLFNIIGSIGTGVLSGHMPRRWILAALYFAFGRHRDLHPDTAERGVGPGLLGPDGRAVAVDRAADAADRGDHVRHALHGDAVRVRLPLAPGRVVPRRLARRSPLRPHRLVRHRLVDVGSARCVRRGRAHADQGNRRSAAGCDAGRFGCGVLRGGALGTPPQNRKCGFGPPARGGLGVPYAIPASTSSSAA